MSFTAAAKKIGLRLSARKTGFLIRGEDRPGAIADLMGKLAAANFNVTASDVVWPGEGRYGAILRVETIDLQKAAKALGAR